MARTWHYPRWRRLLMQSAMWVILGATVALAALIDRNKDRGRDVPLGAAVACGPISLQLPRGWDVQTEIQSRGLVNARGPIVRGSQRTLLVTTSTDPGNELLLRLLRERRPRTPPPPAQPTADPQSEKERLVLPPHLLRELPLDTQVQDEQPITLGAGSFSASGVLLERESTVQDDDGNDVPVGRQLIASGVLPAGVQFTLRLEHRVKGLQELTEEIDDVELIRKIAATVKPVGK